MNENKKALIEYAGAIQKELDEASAAKVGTQWWTDRIRELQGCMRRIEMMR